MDDALERVDLADRGGDKYKRYSLGMKQRLGVAAALMGEPELIVLDEPTNGLDPAGMADMRALVVSLARGGQTVLLSSHLLAEVQEICDRVGVINGGKLLRESTVAELRGGASLRVRATPEDRGARGRDAGGRRRRRTPRPRTAWSLDLPATAAPALARDLVAAGRRRARDRVGRANPRGGLLRDDDNLDRRTGERVMNDLIEQHPRRAPAAAQVAGRLGDDRRLDGDGADVRLPVQLHRLQDRRRELLQRGRDPAQLLHDLLPASMPDVLVQGLPMWGGALAMVLGAIVAGNGYGWGTWKTMFTQGPSRTSSVGGSMLALVVIEVGVMVMTLALMSRRDAGDRGRRVAGRSTGRRWGRC